MTSKQKSINFSFEAEKDWQIPFLDVNVFRENGKFVTNFYRKEKLFQFQTIRKQIQPDLDVITSFSLSLQFLISQSFTLKLKTLRKYFLSNGCSNNFIDKCISKFINKLYIKKSVMLIVPKEQLDVVLAFMGIMPALVKSLHKLLLFCKVKIVFRISNCLKNYFRFKDIFSEPHRSCQIYNFTCGSCNSSYTGKTFRHIKVRVSEHFKRILSTSLRNQMLKVQPLCYLG